MVLAIVIASIVGMYLLIGLGVVCTIIVGYYTKLDPEERRMEKDLNSVTLWDSTISFFVTVLTWPTTVRYIVIGTREALQADLYDNDRTYDMRGI